MWKGLVKSLRTHEGMDSRAQGETLISVKEGKEKLGQMRWLECECFYQIFSCFLFLYKVIYQLKVRVEEV